MSRITILLPKKALSGLVRGVLVGARLGLRRLVCEEVLQRMKKKLQDEGII